MTTPTLAIVGASLAGAKAAEAARSTGFDGRVVLVGEEPAPPYERPPLSKAILRGEAELDAALVHRPPFYDEQSIELVTDTAIALDPVSRTLELAGGDSIAFDSAVLATGAEPRRLDVPGADLSGVHHLRTIDDAVHLRAAIRAATRVVVVGAGWVGSEVAASARQLGAEVVLVDHGSVPLQRPLGKRIGEVFRRLHVDNGVDVRSGSGVRELRGTKSVEEVVLVDGRVEVADVVVVGVGVTPRTALAEAAAGVRTENGIVVDERLATNVDGIYAAGDVANAWRPLHQRHVRIEHWANAVRQGTVAGRNAVGGRDTDERPPFFFSDQYDLGMEYVGLSGPGDAVVVRGDLDAREFVAFWHRPSDGVVTAAMHVNVWGVVDDLEAVVTSGRPIDPSLLADLDVPLGDLV